MGIPITGETMIAGAKRQEPQTSEYCAISKFVCVALNGRA
jgi:hypothetical protein